MWPRAAPGYERPGRRGRPSALTVTPPDRRPELPGDARDQRIGHGWLARPRLDPQASPIAGPAGSVGTRRDVLERIKEVADEALLLGVPARERLAGDDIAREQLRGFLEQPRED